MKKIITIITVNIFFSVSSAQTIPYEKLDSISNGISKLQSELDGRNYYDGNSDFVMTFPENNFKVNFYNQLASLAIYEKSGNKEILSLTENIDLSKAVGLIDFLINDDIKKLNLYFPERYLKTQIIENGKVVNTITPQFISFFCTKNKHSINISKALFYLCTGMKKDKGLLTDKEIAEQQNDLNALSDEAYILKHPTSLYTMHTKNYLKMQAERKLFESYEKFFNLGLDNYKNNNDAAAIAAFDKAESYLKADKIPQVLFFQRGLAKYSAKDYKAAMPDFDKAIGLDPKNSNAFLFRGMSKKEVNDYEGAMEDFNKTIELDPNKSNSYLNRGYLKYNLNDYRGAIVDFNKAIKIDPKSWRAFRFRGISKYYLKEYQEAITDLNTALEFKLDILDAIDHRGYAKFGLKDYAGAITDLNKSIELNPKNSNAYRFRGLSKHNLNDYAGAMADLDLAISLDPGNSLLYINRGHLKNDLDDFKAALIDFNKAIDIDPKEPEAYYHRSRSKFGLGQKEGACIDLNKAGELGYKAAYDAISKTCQ